MSHPITYYIDTPEIQALCRAYGYNLGCLSLVTRSAICAAVAEALYVLLDDGTPEHLSIILENHLAVDEQHLLANGLLDPIPANPATYQPFLLALTATLGA
jgi:hypothetical protein